MEEKVILLIMCSAKYWISAMVKALSCLLVMLLGPSLTAQALERHTLTVEGHERTFWFQPASQPGAPLIIGLHGGGGNGRQFAKFTSLAPAAKAKGFAIVFPDGLDKQWVDGRVGAKLPTGYSDVRFIEEMIRSLGKSEGIDTNAIYLTGISNGGFMSIHLGWKLGPKVKAIAPLTCGVPRNLYDQYLLTPGASFLLINGTEDPLVPFRGGPITLFGKQERGEVVSTDSTYRKMEESLFCSQEAVKTSLPDNDPSDGCTAARYALRCPGTTRCELVVVTGGGHTWPGAKQYLPVKVVGRVCRDFNATRMIAEFFSDVQKDLPNR